MWSKIVEDTPWVEENETLKAAPHGATYRANFFVGMQPRKMNRVKMRYNRKPALRPLDFYPGCLIHPAVYVKRQNNNQRTKLIKNNDDDDDDDKWQVLQSFFWSSLESTGCFFNSIITTPFGRVDFVQVTIVNSWRADSLLAWLGYSRLGSDDMTLKLNVGWTRESKWLRQNNIAIIWVNRLFRDESSYRLWSVNL